MNFIGILTVIGIAAIVGLLIKQTFFPEKKEYDKPDDIPDGYPKPPEDDDGGTPLPDDPRVPWEDPKKQK